MRRNYKNLQVYQKALTLSIDTCVMGKSITLNRLKDQIIGSAISIPSNIAEGSERDSDKFFYNFLNISASSCAELKTQLEILQNVQPELQSISLKLIDDTDIIHRMIRSLMKKVRA